MLTNSTSPRMTDARFSALMRMVNGTRTARSFNTLNGAALDEAVSDWNDILAEVPDFQLETLRLRGLREGLTEPAKFLAMWRASEGRALESEAEEAARQAVREKWQEVETSGRFFVPDSSKLFRAIGRAVVCRCKFVKDGVPVPAELRATSHGDCWECASGSCDFSIDANDEKAVRAASVEPFIEKIAAAAMPQSKAPESVALASGGGLFDELLEAGNVDAENCSETHLKMLRAMARWWARTRSMQQPSADTFAEDWIAFGRAHKKEVA